MSNKAELQANNADLIELLAQINELPNTTLLPHAERHAAGGADALSPESIGALTWDSLYAFASCTTVKEAIAQLNDNGMFFAATGSTLVAAEDAPIPGRETLYWINVEGNRKRVTAFHFADDYSPLTLYTRHINKNGNWVVDSTWKKITNDCVTSNPNLFDNWYFADPINQRGGERLLKGTEEGVIYYGGSGTGDMEGQQAGNLMPNDIVIVTDEDDYYTYVKFNKSDAEEYYVDKGQGIEAHGYISPGYTIDRWKLGSAPMTLSIAGVTLQPSATFQCPLEDYLKAAFLGRPLTFSALINGTLYSGTTVWNNTGEGVDFYRDDTVLLRISGAGNPYISALGEITVLAAKLELSSVQTFAHQDENDNWILNDSLPDKGVELLKCISSTADASDTYANTSFVKKSGDTMTGDLTVHWLYTDGKACRLIGDSNRAQLAIMNVPEDYTNRRMFEVHNSTAASNVINALKLVNVVSGSAKHYYVYGQHNKPKGQYTGNGSSTERIIDLHALGQVVFIWSTYSFGFVVPGGANFYRSGTNDAYGSGTICFSNVDYTTEGKLRIAGTHQHFNQSGMTYYYQVL